MDGIEKENSFISKKFCEILTHKIEEKGYKGIKERKYGDENRVDRVFLNGPVPASFCLFSFPPPLQFQ